MHGQNSTRTSLLRVVSIVHQMGFPALSVTYRNDLGVARDRSGYLQYGETEWRDLEAAVRWALAHGARHVVLAGLSMGGGPGTVHVPAGLVPVSGGAAPGAVRRGLSAAAAPACGSPRR